MAPSAGRLLVPQTWRAIKFTFDKTTRAIRDRLAQSSKTTQPQLQPAYARTIGARHPIHRVAAIRQSRWLSTRRALTSSIRRFSSAAGRSTKVNRAAFPSSRTATAVSQLTTRTPFASTLRPNLTGGTLSRSAGGYGTGAGRVGGLRHFSHSPAAPAEVVNNVSAAMRAFWLSGQRLQYDGSDHRTGAMRYKAVKPVQEKAGRMLQSADHLAPGAYIDFKLSPVITAVGSIGNASHEDVSPNTLNHDGLWETLSVDFARALKDLSIITNDLKRLAAIGNLTLSQPEGHILRVRFPGCDAETLEHLCDELGIQRGIVHEDPDFDRYHGTEMALLFPFAPSHAPSETASPLLSSQSPSKQEQVVWQNMLSPGYSPSPGFSHMSDTSHDYEKVEMANPWLSSAAYSSFYASSDLDAAELFEPATKHPEQVQSEFEGIEGIYRFLEECDRAQR